MGLTMRACVGLTRFKSRDIKTLIFGFNRETGLGTSDISFLGVILANLCKGGPVLLLNLPHTAARCLCRCVALYYFAARCLFRRVTLYYFAARCLYRGVVALYYFAARCLYCYVTLYSFAARCLYCCVALYYSYIAARCL
jgi:hypothetical protein